MRKYFLIVVIISFSQLSTFSQDVDSLQIESLKKKLPHLHDTARINCLLDIAVEYSFWGKDGGDSAKSYVSAANKESVDIGYKYGIAHSLLFSAGKEIFDKKDLTAAEKLIKQALTLGEEINNAKLLGKVYLTWSEIFIRRKDPQLIDILKKALHYFQLAGDEEGQSEASNWICGECITKGQYEEGFEYCERSLNLSKLKRNHTISWGYFLIQHSLDNMAELYKAAGDYETAMNYLREMDKFGKEHKGAEWDMNALIAELFCKMGKYDSAQVYMNHWTKSGEGINPGTSPGHKAWALGVQAQIYLNSNQYDKAIQIFTNSIDTVKKYHPKGMYGTIDFLLLNGEAYTKKKNYKKALQYVEQGFGMARLGNNRLQMMKGYQLISSIYHQMGKDEIAYKNLVKYIAIKDSVQNRQFLLRLFNYKKAAEDAKKESRIGFLNRDNQIKQQQLKQQATFRNFLIAIFIAIIFSGLFVFRNINLKRKNEKLQQQQKEQQWKLKELESENKHVELEKQSAELEMQALRAQMNPHFIFNSLSSINHFILKNESKTASNYLTRFSRLIRMVLINSQKPLITLQDELEMLRIYLDMERLRVKNSFDYVISFINEIDADAVFVPPLILQPFCENALWHGLMHKEGHGYLNIDLSMENNILQCVITDDGIGRAKAAELKSKSSEKEKSLGLQITTQRLALLNQNKNVQTFYTIDDILDESKNVIGTKVILKISHKELKEEFV